MRVVEVAAGGGCNPGLPLPFFFFVFVLPPFRDSYFECQRLAIAGILYLGNMMLHAHQALGAPLG